MAVSTITYTNKVALNENPSVADINKVKADDMNEIKSVVNNNASETSENTQDIEDIISGEVYSTSEVKTNKTWIDNKPIYRKVFNHIALQQGSGVQTIIGTISNLDNVTFSYVHLTTNAGVMWQGYASSSVYIALSVLGDGTVRTRHTFSGETTYAYAIVEYTKTTD